MTPRGSGEQDLPNLSARPHNMTPSIAVGMIGTRKPTTPQSCLVMVTASPSRMENNLPSEKIRVRVMKVSQWMMLAILKKLIGVTDV